MPKSPLFPGSQATQIQDEPGGGGVVPHPALSPKLLAVSQTTGAAPWPHSH